MATIEIYGPLVKEKMYCLHCDFDMTVSGVCVDCNEYKSAVSLEEFFQMNGRYPKLKLVK
jgi:hypothetical protein